MHPALQGALVGLGIGLALVAFEYFALSRQANERAEKFNRKAEFDVTDRRRMHTIFRFAIILPIGFAAAFWLMFS